MGRLSFPLETIIDGLYNLIRMLVIATPLLAVVISTIAFNFKREDFGTEFSLGNTAFIILGNIRWLIVMVLHHDQPKMILKTISQRKLTEFEAMLLIVFVVWLLSASHTMITVILEETMYEK
jgi:hypothetical protein